MLLLVLVVVSVNAAASVEPCCYPEKGEGFVHFLAEIGSSKVAAVANFSVDYTALQVAVSERVYVNGAIKDYKVIQDYKEKKSYIIYKFFGKRKCFVQTMSKALTPRCSLRNATYLGSSYYGVGASALKTNTWGVNLTRGALKVAIVAVITQNNCIPVSELMRGTHHNKPFTEVLGFYNYTLGIKDPAVFVPPKICSKMTSTRALKTQLPVTMQRVLDSVTVPSEEH